MLSHYNVLTVVAGQLAATNQIASGYGETFSADDVMISYLPLAHIFDRCAPPGTRLHACLATGVTGND